MDTQKFEDPLADRHRHPEVQGAASSPSWTPRGPQTTVRKPMGETTARTRGRLSSTTSTTSLRKLLISFLRFAPDFLRVRRARELQDAVATQDAEVNELLHVLEAAHQVDLLDRRRR